MNSPKIERTDGGPDSYACDDCDGQAWPFAALKDITDLSERLDAGGVVPAGECPTCGALCYPTDADLVRWPQLNPGAYPVPPGVQPRAGVECGCGIETCRDCYEPIPDPGIRAAARAFARSSKVED